MLEGRLLESVARDIVGVTLDKWGLMQKTSCAGGTLLLVWCTRGV